MSQLSDKADQAFFEQSRKLSPKFPDVITELERRQRARETIAARTLLVFAGLSGMSTPFVDQPWWMIASAGLFIVGFLITCWVAGSRAHNKAERGSNGLF